MNIRRELLKFKLVGWLASVKLTVGCLLCLFALTLIGTIAQISDGIYLAQQKYFESFLFLLFGFLPFPGAQLVMWVLFVNLISVAFVRLSWRWDRAGILLIHAGLLLFLVSSFITLHFSTESYISLNEGQSTNVSSAYHDWELALWQETTDKKEKTQVRDIISFDAQMLRAGQQLQESQWSLKMKVKEYHRNCRVTSTSKGDKRIEPLEWVKETEQNTPCLRLLLDSPEGISKELILSGHADVPLAINLNNKSLRMLLRLKRYPLPFILKLKDFKKEEHPGTATPRSFESLVEVIENNVGRDKLIAMNEPLRFQDYTVYQASFSEGALGQQTSTFAVVKNVGRLMPYVSTFVTVFGLALHFGLVAIQSKKKKHV